MSVQRGRHVSDHDGVFAGFDRRRKTFTAAVALFVGVCSAGLLMPPGALAENTTTSAATATPTDATPSSASSTSAAPDRTSTSTRITTTGKKLGGPTLQSDTTTAPTSVPAQVGELLRPGGAVRQAAVARPLAVLQSGSGGVQDDEFSARSGVATRLDVLADDQGIPAAATLSVTQAATGGAATVDGDAISYRSRAGFKGDDSFGYQVSSGGAVIGSATVTVHVLPSAGSAVAVDDSASTTPGHPVVIPVLANDVAASTLTVGLPSGDTAHGRVMLGTKSGDVQYTPAAGFSGTDSFEYLLTDAGTEVDRATVTVLVGSPAVAVSDTAVVPFGQTTRIPVRDNDRNASGLFTVVAIQPSAGSVRVNSDGSIDYTAPSTLPTLSTGAPPNITFWYDLTRDAAGTEVVDEAQVTVKFGNPGAMKAGDDYATVAAGDPVRIAVLANDSNARPGDIGRAFLSNDDCETSTGALSVDANGVVSWPDPAGPGFYEGCYTLLSDGVTQDLGRIFITITSDDLGGRLGAVDDTIVVRPPAATTFDPRANDQNADGANVVIDTKPAAGTVSLDGGIVTYRANAHTSARSDSFTYHLEFGGEIGLARAESQVGFTPHATVHVLIDGPVAVDDAARTVANTPVTIPVLANDTGLDPDGAPHLRIASQPAAGSATVDGLNAVYTPRAGFIGTDRFRYSADLQFGDQVFADQVTGWVTVTVGPPKVGNVTVSADPGVSTLVPIPDTATSLDGFSVTAGDPAHGRVSQDAAGRFSYLSDAGFTGTDTFRYSVRSGPDEVAGAEVTVTVRGPVAADDKDAKTVTGIPVRIPVKDNDTNAGGFTVSVGDPPNGSAVVNEDGSVTYTPDPGFPDVASAADTFSYDLLNGAGARVGGAEVTVTVSHLAPQPDSAVTAPGVPVLIDVLANDQPVPPGFAPVVLTAPSSGTAAVTGTGITYTPTPGFESDSFSYVLQDATGRRSAPALVQVRLIDAVDDVVNDPHGSPVTVGVLANDVATGATVQLIGTAHGGTLKAGTGAGTFIFTPGGVFAGTGTFRYGLVVDGRVVDTATVTIHFGDAPRARDDHATTPMNADVLINLRANDLAAGGLSIRVTAGPAHGTIVATSSTSVVYRPNHNFTGIDGFSYVLTDFARDYTSARGTITVTRPIVTSTTTTTTRPTRRTTVTTTAGGGTTPTRGTRTTAPTGSTTPTPTVTPTPPVHRPPDAVNDAVATAPGIPITITVLDNDTGGDGVLDTGSVTVTSPPSHGATVVGAGGLITYTPAPDTAAFTDTFSYRVSDTLGGSDTATVTVRIGALEILQVSQQTVLPGQRVDVSGTGCQPGEQVRFSVDGILRDPVSAGAGGSFATSLEVASDTGRHHVRATCNGRAFDSAVDVIQIVNSGDASSGRAAVALLATVAALLAFYLLTGSMLAQSGGRSRRRH